MHRFRSSAKSNSSSKATKTRVQGGGGQEGLGRVKLHMPWATESIPPGAKQKNPTCLSESTGNLRELPHSFIPFFHSGFSSVLPHTPWNPILPFYQGIPSHPSAMKAKFILKIRPLALLITDLHEGIWEALKQNEGNLFCLWMFRYFIWGSCQGLLLAVFRDQST